MPGEQPILTVNELQISFGGAPPFSAVKNLTFSIQKGKTLAVVGESGSGKSLTALALMGLLPNTAKLSGELRLHVSDNETTAAFPSPGLATYDLQLTTEFRGRDIGMIFQEPMSALNPIMKVGVQLREAILAHQKLSKAEGKRMAIDWLAKVQLLDPVQMYDRYPHEISGGQKQRVMIAMAMCNHPALLIADEPTTALDVTVQQEIMHLMHYLQQEHQSAMLFITHDLALAGTIADEVLVMYKGEMMEYGPVDQVLKKPKHPYTKALLACRPSPAHKGQLLPIVADFLEPKSPPIQLDKPLLKPETDNSIQGTLLKVENLKVWFPGKAGGAEKVYKAVDDVSFTIKKAEILGLVGESGCGKSTISKAIIGLLPVQGGAIKFGSQDLTSISLLERKQVRKSIQMIFQDPYSSLNPRMTIGDILKEPLFVHGIVPALELEKEALRLLDVVLLPADAMHRYPHQFSGGQRQRIGIARALTVRPQLLICDESVSALDVSIQAQILNLLKELQRELQLTYLFISHDLGVVHYISDRVMVMQSGKIVETGDALKVLTQPEHPYTKKLIGAIPV